MNMSWMNPLSWFIKPTNFIIDKALIPVLDWALSKKKNGGWVAAVGVLSLVVTWLSTQCVGWGYDANICQASNHVADVINKAIKDTGFNLFDVSAGAVVIGVLDKIKKRAEAKTEVKVLREVNGLPPAKQP